MRNLARRTLLTGLAGLPLASILADAKLAGAAADSLSQVTLQTAGGQTVAAALALPESGPAPAILLIHEWWGLNDQIKAVAAEFAREGYVALAIDLYGGRVANTREAARSYMNQVDPAAATDVLARWVAWLKDTEGADGKVGTIGWCFGGGWSLDASIAAPVDATVVYYGRVTRGAADLARLKGPVQGHFATRDGWIDRAMVGAFEKEMTRAGKSLETHWYEAGHAFANPTSARYDREDAQAAWRRTLVFFKRHLT